MKASRLFNLFTVAALLSTLTSVSQASVEVKKDKLVEVDAFYLLKKKARVLKVDSSTNTKSIKEIITKIHEVATSGETTANSVDMDCEVTPRALAAVCQLDLIEDKQKTILEFVVGLSNNRPTSILENRVTVTIEQL